MTLEEKKKKLKQEFGNRNVINEILEIANEKFEECREDRIIFPNISNVDHLGLSKRTLYIIKEIGGLE